MTVATPRNSWRPWWFSHRHRPPPRQSWMHGGYPQPKPMVPMVIDPPDNGPRRRASGSKPPRGASDNRGLAGFANAWNGATIASLSLAGLAAGWIGRPSASWGGFNWPLASFSSTRVLSGSPKLQLLCEGDASLRKENLGKDKAFTPERDSESGEARSRRRGLLLLNVVPQDVNRVSAQLLPEHI